MKISTKGRYALRVMIDLATHRDQGLIPLHEIAERQMITVKYLEQIISLLSRAGFCLLYTSTIPAHTGSWEVTFDTPVDLLPGDSCYLYMDKGGSSSPVSYTHLGRYPRRR